MTFGAENFKMETAWRFPASWPREPGGMVDIRVQDGRGTAEEGRVPSLQSRVGRLKWGKTDPSSQPDCNRWQSPGVPGLQERPASSTGLQSCAEIPCFPMLVPPRQTSKSVGGASTWTILGAPQSFSNLDWGQVAGLEEGSGAAGDPLTGPTELVTSGAVGVVRLSPWRLSDHFRKPHFL